MQEEASIRTSIVDQQFTYRFYRYLLDVLVERYSVLPLMEAAEIQKITEPVLFLRHDIDLSIEAAIPMASLEAANNIRATYMIIPTSPIYDARNSANRSRLIELVAMGHEVALHFDYRSSGIDPDDREAIEKAINVQCDEVASLTGKGVASLSFHRPLQRFLFGSDLICGRVNAYSGRLMTFYRSDSRGRWRHGDPAVEFCQAPTVPVAQVLTHPIWWGDTHIPAATRLDHFLGAQTNMLTDTEATRLKTLVFETVPGVARSVSHPS